MDSKRSEQRKLIGFNEDEERTWKGPFTFVQAADTQFGLIDQFKEVPLESQRWDEELKNTRILIEVANRMQPLPRFFVVCGDLVNSGPGESNRKQQEDDWNEVFKDLDHRIPLVCVCGNHDVGNTPTRRTIESYGKAFRTDDYLSFWCGGVCNIVLNSQLFKDASLVPEEAAEHLRWLDEQLAYAKAQKATKVFVFQHIPYFLKEVDEDRDYFSIDPPMRKKLLDKLADAGVNAIFCGHYHRNAGGSYRKMDQIVTSAVGYVFGGKSGARIVNVYKDRIEHTYYAIEDLPASSGLKEE